MKKRKRAKIKTTRRYLKQDIEVDPNNIYPKEIYLSDTDKVTYIYKRDAARNISEVTNVSYEIRIKDEWMTIVRYDSSHGYLHRHLVISKDNPSVAPTTIGVKKKGNHAHWLTWAINDIKKKQVDYKTSFLKRSKLKEIDNS